MPKVPITFTITEISGARRRLLLLLPLLGVLFLAGLLLLRWHARRAKRPLPDKRPQLRPDISELKGLSEAEVEQRRLQGLSNVGVARTSPSRNEIWRENLLSIFNLNLIALGIALWLLGQHLDALLSVAGALFGIALNVRQQLLAKKQVDEIAASTRAEALVVREGEVKSIPPDEIVQGDVLLVGRGDPVFADGQVIDTGQVQVDESAITGNADHLTKRAGDKLYSGSICLAGRVTYEAQKVGDERLAADLIAAEKGTYTDLTPLQGLMDRVLRRLLVVVAIFVVGLMFVYLFVDTDRIDQFFIDAVSMAFGIAPSGLFFMFIISYAVATSRIAKLGAVVYRSQAIESLAYVDVICLGKTSGLFGVSVEMDRIDGADENAGLTTAQVREAIGAFAHSGSRPSPVVQTVGDTFSGDRRPVIEEAPFFSAYGWSAVAFDERDLKGVYVLGEIEALEPNLVEQGAETATSSEEKANKDKAKLSAVTGYAKRLAGVLRRGDKEEVETKEQRPEQNAATGMGAPSTDIEAAPGSPSSGYGDKESDGAVAAPEKEGRAAGIRGMFRRAKTRLRHPRGKDEAQAADQSLEDQERVAARLLFAYAPDVVPLQDARGTPELPDGLIPLCHLRFVEHVREEAVATIQAFADQGVNVKYLASERTEDVAKVAGKSGLTGRDGAAAAVIAGPDLAALDNGNFADAARENEVFGDLTPEQIGGIVRALRDQGFHVAMVGDGINHIGALRNANLKITVQSASEAALSVADMVLLNDSLAEMSQVLVAGQRIVNGLLDMLKLSLVQICYLPVFLTVALFIGFPYAPAHGTFIALFTLSLPSTGLSLWSSSGTVRLSIMRDRLFHFAVPAGVAVTVTALSVHLIVRATTGDVEYAQLVTAYIVVACGLLLFVFVQPPTKAWVGGDVLSGDKRPALLAIGLIILFVLISFIGLAQHFLHVEPLRQATDYVTIALITVCWAFVLRFIWRARPLVGPSEGEKTAGASASGKALRAGN